MLGDPVNGVDSGGLKPGDEYANPHSAAKDAFIEILPISILENVEYGGYVYKNPNGTYSYTAPVTDHKRDGVGLNKNMCPAQTTPYASYHTHGAPNPYDGIGSGGPEHFSKKDLKLDNDENVRGYLGTPNGNMLFHPLNSSYEVGIGHI